MAAGTNLLKQFGLQRNPFVDRTAEKTDLDGTSLYLQSDLQGFHPSETTYVFFGKRGSGKTTIRLQMQTAYFDHNDRAIALGQSRGHFMVDLCRPGHMTACLRNFQQAIHCTGDNWDAQFADSWQSGDVVDCILSFAATELVEKMTDVNDPDGKMMLEVIRADPRACKQFLLLSHLYAKTDAASLTALRAALLRPRFTATDISKGVAIAGLVTAGAIAAAKEPAIGDALARPLHKAWEELDRNAPAVTGHPRLMLAALAAAAVSGTSYYARCQNMKALERAAQLTATIRVVKQQPPSLIAALLRKLFSPADRVDTIRSMCIGISAHQKLELLSSLCRQLGYESVAVFGDCFDEVGLLDPVQYPGAIKAFAKEVCRNDLLNFGRLHFFFPDSRLALDLNTDKTLKEARFDRHFVRDLTWSRHQLEELAERRFRAAQRSTANGTEAFRASTDAFPDNTSFQDLFKKVRVEDFSSYIAKLSTPRELMIMMTEMFSRIEANPKGELTAQDMEIAVTKALEQAV